MSTLLPWGSDQRNITPTHGDDGWQSPSSGRVVSVPFNHNDHYHPLLLRQVPAGARTALDVGCGTGRFARRLAAAGLDVDGIDQSDEVIDAACAFGTPGPGKITYRQEDVTKATLPDARYDFISC